MFCKVFSLLPVFTSNKEKHHAAHCNRKISMNGYKQIKQISVLCFIYAKTYK